MDSSELMKYFGIFYFLMMISLVTLYLRVMYTQYKNAHDKWFDINRDYKKVDKEIYKLYDDPSLLINQLD